jgi:polyhydroxyalkanoate synthase
MRLLLEHPENYRRSLVTKYESMAAIGYCVGGTFLAAHLALRPERVSRVCFLATPIDFHASGRLATWATPATFPLDAIVDGLGNFPKELMRTSFQWLKPQGMTSKWASLWERIDQDGFPELWAALEKWNEDGVDFPGEAYREYVGRCYFDNALVKGGWTLAGTPVDLHRATMPALVLACSDDHIVPPPAAHALRDVWGGPVETETIKGGHVGVCVGGALPKRLIRWLEG